MAQPAESNALRAALDALIAQLDREMAAASRRQDDQLVAYTPWGDAYYRILEVGAAERRGLRTARDLITLALKSVATDNA
jgi:hypothetical protein